MRKIYLILVLLTALSQAFAQLPVISSFSPASGPIGTTVTITGSNFNTTAASNVVYFGANRATVTAATATQLTVTAPATGATGMPISVLNTSSALTGYARTAFINTFPSKGSIVAADFDSKFDVGASVDANIKAPENVQLADLDGDGALDMVITNSTSASTATPYAYTISVLLNNFTKNGTFSATSFGTKLSLAASTTVAGGNSTGPFGVAIGDLDGDGKPDLVVSNSANATISIYKNTSTGKGNISFSKVGSDIATASGPKIILIGDYDGDGKPDVAVTCTNGSKVCVFPNTTPTAGTIAFGTRIDMATPGTGSLNLAQADLDGDGKVDLVTANSAQNSLSLFRNTSTSGAISFDAAVNLTTVIASPQLSPTAPYGLAIGDMDGDGKPDIVATTFSSGSVVNSVVIFVNAATSGAAFTTASFTAKVISTTVTSNRYGVTLVDLDGDGKLDMVTLHTNNNLLNVMHNTTTTAGNITFDPDFTMSAGTTPHQITSGDLDGDGKPDLAMANAGATSVAASIIHTNPTPFVNLSAGASVFATSAAAGPVAVDNALAIYSRTKTTLASATISITGNFTASEDLLAFTANAATMGNIAGSYNSTTGILSLASSGNTATIAQWRTALQSVTYSNTNAAPTVLTRTISFAVNDGTTAGASIPKALTINYNSNVTVDNLAISAGTLSPAFASATKTYTVSVPASTGSITLTPTLNDSHATVTVNGTAVTSGSPSGNITLASGANTITMIVTAADGTTTSTYTITVNQAISANADLSSLAISSGTLNPAFASGTSSYTASVATGTNSVTVTPTAADAAATLTVNGTAVTSGSASGSIAIADGANVITIKVTAPDGTNTKSYTLTVNKALSTNANLSALTISSGTLSPSFSTLTNGYTVSLPNNVSSLTVTPTSADATATVKVNGTSVTSGNASSAIALNVGSNSISVAVTAEDGTTVNTYTLSVSRAAASNANLSNLSLSSGTLSPAFSSGTLTYGASVANSTGSVTLTPTAADAGAVITVNGNTVNSGNPSSTIALSVGANTIAVKVTAQDGSTIVNYSVTVTRAASNDASLSAISLSSGTLSPSFGSSTAAYAANVANNIPSITLTASSNQANAVIKINGATVASGSASGSISLAVGANTITILVTAQDGSTQQTYTVTVTRAGSSNADLAGLDIDNGNLTPSFSASTTSYVTGETSAVNSITVTPTVADPTATIKVNGTTVASGSGVVINISTGTNTITTVVTAQNGTTKTYTISAIKSSFSNNADLSGIVLSSGTLAPAFDPNKNTYTVAVPNGTTSMTLKPTSSDANATIKVNGTSVASGNASGAINLVVGSNTITTIVTAQDNITQNTYTVNVTRAASSNADLAAFAISSGTLSPVFAAGMTAYTTSVGNATTTITVTPAISDATASIKVNGTAVASGSTSGNIALNVGANTINTVVTAQDGSTKTYTLTVTRAASSNANLSALAISNGTLSPAFATATSNYTATVANGVTSLTLTPTLTDATATFKVNGTTVSNASASAGISLNVGSNTITIVVTAQDGATTKTYTLAVTRAPSTNADLSNIALSSGTLAPAFAASTSSYTATVSNATASLSLTPTLSDATATVKVNGTTVSNGSASAAISLAIGSNTLSVAITAQDGTTTRTYTVTVTRLATPQTITFGTLSAATYGSADLNPGATSTNSTIPITYTSSNTAVATITAGGAIHIVAAGTTTVTASQSGNASFAAATPVSQNLTVNPASLTVTATNQTKVYGSVNPTLSVTYSGFVNTDDASVLTTLPVTATTAVTASPVGSYPITASGAAASNYTISYVAGTLTVGKATLTITAPTLTKTYGTANPVLTPTFSGFVNGDNSTKLSTQPIVTTTAITSSPAGSYPTIASGAAAANYTFVYNAGTLQVNPAVLTVTVAAATKVYGTALPAFTFTYTGFVNGDTQAALTTLPVASTTATAASPAGSYPVTASGAASANYTMSYVAGTLTVSKAPLTITAVNQSRIFNTANPAFTATYTGFVNGDDATALSAQPSFTTTATQASAIGSYPITPSGAASNNYTLSYVAGTLTVTVAARTLVFNPLPVKTYGDADFAPGATVDSGEPITYTSSNTTAATIVNGLIHITGAGTTTITATLPVNANYTGASSLIQTLQINRASQTISYSNVGPLQLGSPAQIVLTSTSGLTVSLSSSDTYVAAVTNTGGAAWSINPLHIGSSSIIATQGGDANYLPAIVSEIVKVQNGAKDDILIHSALSPNGDGENDSFTIDGIKDYQQNKLTIFNRNGVKVFEQRNYDNVNNVFDGHSNLTGAMMQQGSYFFQLEYKVNGSTKTKVGYILLKY